MSYANKLCFGACCCSSTAKACARLQLSQAEQEGTGAESLHSHTWPLRRDGMRELLPLNAQQGTDDAGESQSPWKSLDAYTLFLWPHKSGGWGQLGCRRFKNLEKWAGSHLAQLWLCLLSASEATGKGLRPLTALSQRRIHEFWATKEDEGGKEICSL